MAVLESRLTITAIDETGKAFGEIQKRIASLEKSAVEVERVFANLGRVTNEASLFSSLAQREDMNAAIANMEKLIALTERAAGAQKGLANAARSVSGALRGESGGSHGGRARGGHGGGVVGALTLIGAPTGGHAVLKAVENAAELEQARFRIRELSRKDPREAALADRLADEVSGKYPGITRAKALDTYSELRANAVDLNGRIDPVVARRNLMAAATAQNAALALGFEMTPVDMQNLLKGVEGSGRAGDPKAVEKITDAYIRAKQVFGSAIASDMIRDYTANAKSANFSIGDDQFYLANMVRLSEGNAARLGNEVNQTLTTLGGGHMTKATGAWLVAHGLASADQIVKTGPSTVAIKGGLKDEGTLQTNQAVWAATTFKKAIEDSGALSDAKVSARMAMLRGAELKRNPNAEIDERFLRERAEEGLIAAEIAKSGMRTSVTDNLAHFIGNQRLIDRDIAATLNASGSSAGDRIGENPVAAFSELTSAVSNFATVLASPAIAAAAPALDALAHKIAEFTAYLEKFQGAHPQAATATSAGALAAAAAGVGWMGVKLYSGITGLFGGGGGVAGGGAAVEGGLAAAGPPGWLVAGLAAAFAAYLKTEGRGAPMNGGVAPVGAGDRAKQVFGGLSSSVGAWGAPVQVSGQATVSIPVKVEVTASSTLLQIVQRVEDAAKTMIAQIPLNPVAGGHTGRMDSDAAPLGRGGSYSP